MVGGMGANQKVSDQMLAGSDRRLARGTVCRNSASALRALKPAGGSPIVTPALTTQRECFRA